MSLVWTGGNGLSAEIQDSAKNVRCRKADISPLWQSPAIPGSLPTPIPTDTLHNQAGQLSLLWYLANEGKWEESTVNHLRSIGLATFLVFSLIGPANAAQPIMSAEQVERVRDSFIFVFDNSIASNDVAQKARRLAANNNGRLIHTYSHAIRGFTARMPAEAAARMASNNPNIAYFEPDQIAYPFPPPWCADNPNDPRCGGDDGESGGDASPGQETPWGIVSVNGGISGMSGTAWVIDTGVDLDHPDLNVDTTRSRNFVSKGKDNGGDDPDGHGTHVAGTIAAIDNDIGVIGVAAGATVVSVRVLGRNGGTYSDVIAGVDYVAANGTSEDVANMSLGGGRSDALNDAVAAAAAMGPTFVVAAGNSSACLLYTSPSPRDQRPNLRCRLLQ